MFKRRPGEKLVWAIMATSTFLMGRRFFRNVSLVRSNLAHCVTVEHHQQIASHQECSYANNSCTLHPGQSVWGCPIITSAKSVNFQPHTHLHQRASENWKSHPYLSAHVRKLKTTIDQQIQNYIPASANNQKSGKTSHYKTKLLNPDLLCAYILQGFLKQMYKGYKLFLIPPLPWSGKSHRVFDHERDHHPA